MTLLKRLLLVIFILVAGGVSAQQISQLPIGKNTHLGVTTATIIVGSYEAGYQLVRRQHEKYTHSERGLEGFLRDVLQTLPTPKPGTESALYYLYVSTDWVLGYDGRQNLFKLEQTTSGYRIPESALNFEWEYGGVGIYATGATDFEIETQSQHIFSTIGEGRSLEIFECDVLAAKSGLKRGEVGGFGGELVDPTSPDRIRTLTIYENDRFVTFNGDGIPIRWSSPPPSFFLPPPAMILQKTGNGQLELVVNADGTVEESETVNGPWGPPNSLSSVKLASDSQQRRFSFTQTSVMKFYRLRVGAQKQ